VCEKSGKIPHHLIFSTKNWTPFLVVAELHKEMLAYLASIMKAYESPARRFLAEGLITSTSFALFQRPPRLQKLLAKQNGIHPNGSKPGAVTSNYLNGKTVMGFLLRSSLR
jgi:hypothetical protein